jgi:hypothetical protein
VKKNVRSFLCLLVAGGFTTLSPLYGTAATVQLSAQITGFNLSTCGPKNCLTVKSENASVGMLGGNYAFASAKVTINDRKTGKSEVLSSKDTYYDIASKKLFMRDLADKRDADAIYDLEKEKLSFFPSEKKI